MNLMSENINELMASLAKAQGKIQSAAKDKANPYFKSKYADLASIWDACRPALSENGLAVVQTIRKDSDGMALVTTLGHASGQWISSEMPIISAKSDPQSLGSAITYYRRYSLSAIVGVAPDDDDGEKAQAPYRNQQTSPNVKQLYISQEQLESLQEIVSECEPSYEEWLLKAIKKQFNAADFSGIPADKFPSVYESAMKRKEEFLKKQKDYQEAAQ